MEITPILLLVRRARQRIRIQAALDALATSLVPASWLTALAAITARWGPPEAAVALLVGAVAVIAAMTIVAVTRPLEDESIARRIDRASGLADRLSSAIAFEGDEDGFKQLAVADGVRAADRAGVREATPFRIPRHAFAAIASVLLASIVQLALPAIRDPEVAFSDDVIRIQDDPPVYWDTGYADRTIGELRGSAVRAHEPQLVEDADALAVDLHDLAAGTITKDKLLARLALLDRALDRELSRDVALALDDTRDAIRRLKPEVHPGPLGPDGPGDRSKRGPQLNRPDVQLDPGVGHEPLAELPQPRVPQPTRDVMLSSLDPAATHRATIETAAQQGFASAEYAKVYADYTKHDEDVVHPEAVPSSRRAVIRRYFDRIRPR